MGRSGTCWEGGRDSLGQVVSGVLRVSLFSTLLSSSRGKSMCPPTTLTSLLEREMQTRPPPPIPHHRHQTDKNPGSSNLQKIAKEPVIDYFDVQD